MEKSEMQKFGQRIVNLRKEHGESQESLLEILGVTQQTLSRYEKGERQASLEFVIKAAKHYNVSADYLLGLSDAKTTEQDTKKLIATSGLSEKSIKNLTRPYQQKLKILEEENNDEMSSSIILIHCEEQLMTLNLLLESKHFFKLLATISNALSLFKRIEQWGKDTEIFLTSDNNPDMKISCELAYKVALLNSKDVISMIIKEDTENAKHNTPKE